MNEQPPAVIDRTEFIGDECAHVVPALIASSSKRASYGSLGFLAANIRKPHTRED
jgi:hypothetical protein